MRTYPTDEDLLAGSAEDFAEFYCRTEAAVIAYFRARVPDAELAADLTAESFARALAGRHRFDADRGPARSWLFGIAGHVLSRSVAKRRVDDRVRRRLKMEPIIFDDDALARVDALVGVDAVALLLEGLPDHQREAVKARVVLEKPYAQVAAQLCCSEMVARKHVSRGLAAIRHRLKKEVVL